MSQVTGIYKINCSINGKFYIGSSINIKKRMVRHYSDLRNNKHHNIHLQRAWLIYGPEAFSYEIFKEVAKNELKEEEDKILKLLDFSTAFNIAKDSCGGDNLTEHPNKKDIVAKISKKMKENMKKLSCDERKKKYGNSGEKNGMFNKKHSDETKNKISKLLIGKESYRKNKTLEECHGLEKATELKKNLSETAKKRIGEKNPFYGKKHSDETKNKISSAKKGQKTQSQLKPFTINEKKYLSLMDAQKDTGIPYTTIRWRLISKNIKYSNYKYI